MLRVIPNDHGVTETDISLSFIVFDPNLYLSLPFVALIQVNAVKFFIGPGKAYNLKLSIFCQPYMEMNAVSQISGDPHSSHRLSKLVSIIRSNYWIFLRQTAN